MTDVLEEHEGKVSIGDRNIINLRFADDIDVQAELLMKSSQVNLLSIEP